VAASPARTTGLSQRAIAPRIQIDRIDVRGWRYDALPVIRASAVIARAIEFLGCIDRDRMAAARGVS